MDFRVHGQSSCLWEPEAVEDETTVWFDAVSEFSEDFSPEVIREIPGWITENSVKTAAPDR